MDYKYEEEAERIDTILSAFEKNNSISSLFGLLCFLNTVASAALLLWMYADNKIWIGIGDKPSEDEEPVKYLGGYNWAIAGHGSLDFWGASFLLWS